MTREQRYAGQLTAIRDRCRRSYTTYQQNILITQ